MGYSLIDISHPFLPLPLHFIAQQNQGHCFMSLCLYSAIPLPPGITSTSHLLI